MLKILNIIIMIIIEWFFNGYFTILYSDFFAKFVMKNNYWNK